MESALRPREIQARIRSGQTLDEVAQVAGVPIDQIETYASPVLAEREYVAHVALGSTVRRRGEGAGHRHLRDVVADHLTSQGIDPDIVAWDAWRKENRRWVVCATYAAESGERDAHFDFDLAGRTAVTANDDARWLIGELVAEPERYAGHEDSDELALVRAVSEAPNEAAIRELPTTETGTDQPDTADERSASTVVDLRDRFTRDPEAVHREPDLSPKPVDDHPRSAATPLEIAEEVEAEIDSYGLVPEGRSELDVLYDMLGGIAEDSVNIYAGLSAPVVDRRNEPMPASRESAPEPSLERPAAPAAPSRSRRKAPRPALKDISPEEVTPDEITPDEITPDEITPEEVTPEEVTPDEALMEEENEPTNVIQKPLSGVSDETVPVPTKRRGRKRASVPSWDEIMFGAPKKD